MPPKRDTASTSVSVEDLVNALQDRQVVEAIGSMFKNKLKAVYQEVHQLKNENLQHKQEINELKSKLMKSDEKLNALEAYNRIDNLIIAGLPVHNYADAANDGNSTENSSLLESEVLDLFNTLSLDTAITRNDISVVHRLKSTQANRNPGLPPPIIVRFANRKTRDLVYRSRRQLHEAREQHIFMSSTSMTSINEDLVKTTAELFRLARLRKKQKNILSTWTHHGTVYVRVNNDTRPQKITEVSDLPA